MPTNTHRPPDDIPDPACDICERTGYIPSGDGGVIPCPCGGPAIDLGPLLEDVWTTKEREVVAAEVLEIQADADRRGVGRWFIAKLERVRKMILGTVEEEADTDG